jgi:hypothetical protein
MTLGEIHKLTDDNGQRNLISAIEIIYKVEKDGFIFVPGVGKLRAHTLSRRGIVALCIGFLCLWLVSMGAQNLRVAGWQAQAVKESLQVASLQAALTDQQAANHVNVDQLAQCMTTLVRYENTLARVTAKAQEAQQANPGNPGITSLVQILGLLKNVL